VAHDHHDIVVIGASAGGVEALNRLVASLGAPPAAAIFVVLHLPTNAHSFLPKILGRAGTVAVQHAEDGMVPEPGRVYVAPPDHHLLLKRERMHLVRGPTENGHRPAIDPLFRSAAEAHGSRVIGIVLSGVLDDGTNGLLAIASHGGLTVVQDPDDALYPSMPLSAIDNVPVDVIADAGEIGASLPRLVDHRTAPLAPVDTLDDYTERALEGGGALEMVDRPSRFTCPDCGGSLWDGGPDEPGKFRCRVGHSWTTRGLLEQQAVALDQALWTALRALSERADLMRRLRDRASAAGHGYGEKMYAHQLEEYETKAEVVRAVLRSPDPPLHDDLQMPMVDHPEALDTIGPPDDLPVSS
jgi:two-component system chemotaxis response regulator CheB